MTLKHIAQQYIDAGWQVVPLLKGEKRASTKWRTDTYTSAHFHDGDNIALKCGEPSNWLVDVDLECAEAIAAAKELLPRTPLVHGRPSKPSSHHWFVCRDIKTSQFRDVKGANSEAAMIAEIRSTGGYTAAPPSLHPRGEALTWESQGAPMPIEADVLYACVRDIAITALIARHWSDFGHDDTGPLAGFLCRGGVLDTVRIIKLARPRRHSCVADAPRRHAAVGE